MPGINYLDDQTQNIYAAGQMGKSFADMLRMRNMAQLEAMKYQNQQAMDQAYFQLERQKQARAMQESQQKMRFAAAEESRRAAEFQTAQDAARQKAQMDAFEIARAQQAADLARQTLQAQRQAAFATRMLHPVDMSRQPLPETSTFYPQQGVIGGPTLAAQRQLNQSDLAEALATIAYSQPAVAGRAMEPQVYRPGDVVQQPFGGPRETIPQSPEAMAELAARTLAEQQRAKYYGALTTEKMAPDQASVADLTRIIQAYQYDRNNPIRIRAEQQLQRLTGGAGGASQMGRFTITPVD